MRRCTPRYRGGVTSSGAGSVPYTVRLNWIPLSGISAPTSFKTTHGALPPGPNFHPWSLCCRQERAECKKEANRKNEEKYRDDEGWVFHDTNGLLISHARASLLQFSALRQDISVKKGGGGEKERRSREKNGDTRAERKANEIKRKSVNGSFLLFRVRNLRDKKVKGTRSAMCSKSFPHSIPPPSLHHLRNESTLPILET